MNLGSVCRPCQARQDPRVALPLRNPPPIRPFEQRNQVLARQAGPITQLGRCCPAQLTERRFERAAKLLQRRFRRVTLLVDLFYTAFAGEETIATALFRREP